MEADQIAVLRHGHITERGRHADLATRVQADGHLGWYAAQWKVQQIEVSLMNDAAAPLGDLPAPLHPPEGGPP
jgi:ATP-binding cassette subfamily B protein/ATP-binding cassette subfamily C protein/ATP-binding cassette subfamily B multidrug efflux pump